MFLGNKIRYVRKQKKISQIKLADGICTQATISRIEGQNIPPSLTVLIQICKRLDITLDELFTEFSQGDNNLEFAKQIKPQFLENVDTLYIKKKYSALKSLLKEHSLTQINGDQNKAHYMFIVGDLSLELEQNKDNALFYFHSIIEILKEQRQTIFGILAYIDIGKIYSQQNEVKKAKFYLEIALSLIKEIVIDNDTSYFWYIKAITELSTLFSNIKEYKTSNQLISIGISPTRGYYSTMFTDQLYFLLSVNHMNDQSIDYKEIAHTLTAAKAFAEYNRNTDLLNKIISFMKYHHLKFVDVENQA